MEKICLINSLYPPYQRGGAEVMVQRIIRGFVDTGFAVVVITLGRRDSVTVSGPVTIYRIKPLNIFSFLDIQKRPIWLRVFWHPLDVFNLSAAKKIKRILKTEQPRTVFTHNLKGLGYLIPRAIRSLKIQHIHTLHDVQLSRPSGIILYGEKKPFLVIDKMYEKICQRLFASPDVVISPSRWLLQYYTTRGFFLDSKKIVLPNPVVFKHVDKPESAIAGDVTTLLYVGQLERSKGVLFLIEACKRLKSNTWQLIIVGSGNLDDRVKELVQDDERFRLIGRVHQQQLFSWYRRANLTVVPSLCYENSPSVIYESLVANVPVIASDIGGISELVKDDYNGFTFAPGNEKNLVEVLEHFISHPGALVALKKNCFVSVREYSLKNYIKQLEQCMGNVSERT